MSSGLFVIDMIIDGVVLVVVVCRRRRLLIFAKSSLEAPKLFSFQLAVFPTANKLHYQKRQQSSLITVDDLTNVSCTFVESTPRCRIRSSSDGREKCLLPPRSLLDALLCPSRSIRRAPINLRHLPPFPSLSSKSFSPYPYLDPPRSK